MPSCFSAQSCLSSTSWTPGSGAKCNGLHVCKHDASDTSRGAGVQAQESFEGLQPYR